MNLLAVGIPITMSFLGIEQNGQMVSFSEEK